MSAPSAKPFEVLIKRHSELLQSPSSEKILQVQVQEFLEGFVRCLNRSEADEAKQAERDRGAFPGLLAGYQDARASWAKAQEATADDFNLLEVMDVVGDENCHSNILAWLLDRRIEHGTHAQGNLGFRLFLKALAACRT